MPLRIISLILSILCLVIIIEQGYAQGCSDAGFCTMGAMRPNQHFSSKKAIRLRSVEVLQYVGFTKFKDVILSTLVDVNFSIGRHGSAQVKLPFTSVSGSLANTYGLSDISYSYTHALVEKQNYQLLATIGGKIPTNNASKQSADGRPLPMYYQTSLGTYDLVAGASFIARNWLFAAGYQQALTEADSKFRWSEWNTSTQKAEALAYPPSWKLRRGSDVMARVERNFRSTKWNAYLGLLAIYRITKDEISKGNENNRIAVAKTTGPAITALSGVGYKFSAATAIKGMFGQKITNRETNPDGLSREWVATLSVEIRL